MLSLRYFIRSLFMLTLCIMFLNAARIAAADPVCPENSNPINGSCDCFNPGYSYNAETNTCVLLEPPPAVTEAPLPGSEPPADTIPVGNNARDARLNPVADEYYTVYCQNDVLEIWRGVPSSQNLANIPLAIIAGVEDGASSSQGSYGLARAGDTLMVSGNDGNAAPAAGTKSFSLAACYAANGRTPPTPTAVPTPVVVTSETYTTLYGEECTGVFSSLNCLVSFCSGAFVLPLSPTFLVGLERIWRARRRRHGRS